MPFWSQSRDHGEFTLRKGLGWVREIGRGREKDCTSCVPQTHLVQRAWCFLTRLSLSLQPCRTQQNADTHFCLLTEVSWSLPRSFWSRSLLHSLPRSLPPSLPPLFALLYSQLRASHSGTRCLLSAQQSFWLIWISPCVLTVGLHGIAVFSLHTASSHCSSLSVVLKFLWLPFYLSSSCHAWCSL